jgi:hypothetical protein
MPTKLNGALFIVSWAVKASGTRSPGCDDEMLPANSLSVGAEEATGGTAGDLEPPVEMKRPVKPMRAAITIAAGPQSAGFLQKAGASFGGWTPGRQTAERYLADPNELSTTTAATRQICGFLDTAHDSPWHLALLRWKVSAVVGSHARHREAHDVICVRGVEWCGAEEPAVKQWAEQQLDADIDVDV